MIDYATPDPKVLDRIKDASNDGLARLLANAKDRWPRWFPLRAIQTHRRHLSCQCNLRTFARIRSTDRSIYPFLQVRILTAVVAFRLAASSAMVSVSQ